MSLDADLLGRLERYYDAVPRARSTVEEVGPFTLFVAESGWPFYARPRLGKAHFTAADVRRVFDRQLELDVPEKLEWVHDVTPGLIAAVREAGAGVEECPLLVLDGQPRGERGTALMVDLGDEASVVASRAAVSVGFGYAGTAVGPAGVEARDEALKSKYAELDEALRERLAAGQVRTAAVWAPDAADLGPVGGGSYSPVDDVAEIAGVAVLPAYRRRGLAAQLTHVLAAHALARGATTVFCSAQSDDVARVYEGIGFRRVGTACIAELDTDD